jgi:tRNA pseudouridine55 synthase
MLASGVVAGGRTVETGLDGLLVLDKPGGITSREALDRALRWFPRRTRVGHAGTLDPLATGVLVLCLGGATRLVEYVQAMGKTYKSLFRLGATSDSDDADGTVTPVPGAADPGPGAVAAALAGLVGTIEQVPPAYSAAKVAGRRAHALARRGEDVTLRARPVQVHAIDVLRYAYPDLEVEVRCGKGTYVRSLARDLGRALGCGAFVQTLRRTRVGPFTAEAAARLDMPPEEARLGLLPLEAAVAELPRAVLPPREVGRLRSGQAVALPPALAGRRGEVGVFDGSGSLVAIAITEGASRLLRPAKVLS